MACSEWKTTAKRRGEAAGRAEGRLKQELHQVAFDLADFSFALTLFDSCCDTQICMGFKIHVINSQTAFLGHETTG